MAITFRLATTDDLSAINRIHYDALEQWHDFYGAFFALHPRELLPRLNARAMRIPSQIFLVAVEQDEVVGFVRYQMVDATGAPEGEGPAQGGDEVVEPIAALAKPKEHLKELWERFSERDAAMDECYGKAAGGRRHAYVKHLMVHPSQQRKGIGGGLLGEVVSRADAAGLPTVIVSSAEGHGLYARLGFQDLDTFRIDNGYWAREVARTERELGVDEGNGDLGDKYGGLEEVEKYMMRWPKCTPAGETS